MYPVPLIVLDADAFAEIPVAPPNDRGAVTVKAFADVAGLLNDTRITNVVPAMYVPLPLNAVKLVIDKAACALRVILNAVLGPALSERAVISSLPETDAVIDKGWLAVPAAIVIRKSMAPAPLIVFDADAFAVTPATKPFNDAVTVNAFADVAGLFNETLTKNVVPATNVPLPLCKIKLVIASDACAFTLTFKFEPDAAFNGREVISSDPEAVALIVTA